MMLPKINLRAMEPEDLDTLYAIENDTSVWSAGTTNVPYSRYILHEYIANATGDIYTDRQVRLMIENDKTCVVGIVDIVNFDPSHQRAEVGIVIKSNCRSNGYATAAIAAVTSYSLNVLHLHQLFAIVAANNSLSLKLFKKSGFRQTAILADWLFDGQDYHDALLMQLFL